MFRSIRSATVAHFAVTRSPGVTTTFMRQCHRTFLPTMSSSSLSTDAVAASNSNDPPEKQHDNCSVLILGAGSGGCAIAAQLKRALNSSDKITIVEPSEQHYYQPMFTMIGGGMYTLADACRPMASVIPSGVHWLRDAARHIDPATNSVHTESGRVIRYETLIIAVGLRTNYTSIPGLQEALEQPGGNVTSIYSPRYVHRHYEALQRFDGRGALLFTFPKPPVKCPGAPQKIAYLSEHYLRRNGKRTNAQLSYHSALPVIFGVKYFADALWPIARNRGIDVRLQQHLVEVQVDRNRAIFESVERPGEREAVDYAVLHVTPPQEVPELLRRSAAAKDGLVTDAGFVDVDEQKMRHRRYANVWAVGDCGSTPNSKTMAAAATQSGIVTANILAVRKGQPLTASYDGYAACPLITGYDTCVMAEFDYRLQPLETFPIAQNRELRFMFWMKRFAMPLIYWQGMLKGLWTGPALLRKTLNIFRRKHVSSRDE